MKLTPSVPALRRTSCVYGLPPHLLGLPSECGEGLSAGAARRAGGGAGPRVKEARPPPPPRCPRKIGWIRVDLETMCGEKQKPLPSVESWGGGAFCRRVLLLLHDNVDILLMNVGVETHRSGFLVMTGDGLGKAAFKLNGALHRPAR